MHEAQRLFPPCVLTHGLSDKSNDAHTHTHTLPLPLVKQRQSSDVALGAVLLQQYQRGIMSVTPISCDSTTERTNERAFVVEGSQTNHWPLHTLEKFASKTLQFFVHLSWNIHGEQRQGVCLSFCLCLRVGTTDERRRGVWLSVG